MDELFEQLTNCVERGKVDTNSVFPVDMKGSPGAAEFTIEAIEKGYDPDDILNALIFGMERVGLKFRENKVFVPEVLMAAKAMSVAMKHLRPFFQKGIIGERGVLLIGTVAGDLHDMGKNLVAMMVEGCGWKIVDIGTNVSTEKFLLEAEKHPGCYVALSALLTTTMVNMENTVSALKEKFPDIKVLIGGAPVTAEFCESAGADFYSRDPMEAIEYLNKYKP